ncbi:alpha-L-fucosidase [Okeania hirsuta]|nr:alpha-L-fucosidase [Okeania hirsuta]
MVKGSSWGYNKDKRPAIDPQQAIRILAEVVSKNGVMILSAAPTAAGIIPVEQVSAMEKIGHWLKLYGEAIYDTRPFVEFGQGTTKLKRNAEDEWNDYGAIKVGLDKLSSEDIRYTQKGNTVYAIQLGGVGPKKKWFKTSQLKPKIYSRKDGGFRNKDPRWEKTEGG